MGDRQSELKLTVAELKRSIENDLEAIDTALASPTVDLDIESAIDSLTTAEERVSNALWFVLRGGALCDEE